jgi:ferritin
MEDFITFKTFGSDDKPIIESPSMPGAEVDVTTIKSDRPIQPKGLSKEIELRLTQRLGDEYTAHFFYRNAANWCKNVNYPKAAAYFEAEAQGELEHAKGIQDYITQWNLYPMIPSVETSAGFTSLVDIINQAYEIEYNLLQEYSANQKEIFGDHPATFNFVQKYVDIQNEAVSEYSDLLNALQLIDVEDRLSILYFEKEYFG